MNCLSPEPQTLRRAIQGVLVACGFLITCALTYRDARQGYEVRVQNGSGRPIEVYLVRETAERTQTTHLFDVPSYEISRPYVLGRDETGELVFAPRGTGRRIARVELPGDALKAVRQPVGSLLVNLYPSRVSLSNGSEWGIRKPLRISPEAPLLYIGAFGWLYTLKHRRIGKRPQSSAH